MIAEYKKKSNIAAGVWLATMAILIYMFSGNSVEGNIWETGNIPVIIVFTIHGLSFAAALWWYAKAKGYWGILGLLLMFLSIIGLIIIALLPDKNKIDTT